MNINKISNNSPLARGVAGGTRRGVANSPSAAQKGCRVAPVGLVATALCAIIVATAAYAAGENIVASKKYTDDTFQTKISTGNVLFWDDDGDGVYDAEDYDYQVPGLVAYDPTTGALSGTKIGILDRETIENDEGSLYLYSSLGGYGAEMDNFVPTVRAVAEELQNIWNNMPNIPSALSWTNTQTAAVNNYSTAFNNTTNNWPNADSGRMVTGLSLANGLALKQNKIPAGTATINNTAVPSVVAYTDTAGSVGEIGILDKDTYDDIIDTGLAANPGSDRGSIFEGSRDILIDEYPDKLIAAGALGQMFYDNNELLQYKIPKSGYPWSGSSSQYNTNAANTGHSWLNANVKGTGLVTKTARDGTIGERKIFESTDVANYHAAALSQNEKDIQDISIPTVGAMMTAIQNGSAALIPAGTAGNVVTYTGTAGVVGSNTVASAATYDQQSGALTNGSAIANVTLVETKQNTIPTGNVLLYDNDGDGVYDESDGDIELSGLVAYDSTTGGLNGKKIGIADKATMLNTIGWEDGLESYYDDPGAAKVVLTADAIAWELSRKQGDIPATINGYTYNQQNRPTANGSLVETTGTAGAVTQRGIATAPTYDANNQLSNGSWIPTMGAMMTAIQNGSAALIPAGTAGNVVTYTGTAGSVGSTAVASAATYDQQSGALTNGSSIANVTLVETKQKKKVCAGWPSDVAVADRTDANCWLWYFPD